MNLREAHVVEAINDWLNELFARENRDDRTVLDGIARLKERGLLRTVWAGAGSRVLTYHQRLEERLALSPGSARCPDRDADAADENR